jgi:outer membrane biosynthesis protein TonB
MPIDIAKWLGPGSYPWEYLRNSLSVRIQLRMMTDESGAVTQCVVQSPSGTSVAGTLACREIVKTARFEPALDADGTPVASYYSTAIVYMTPRQNGPGHGVSRTQGL